MVVVVVVVRVVILLFHHAFRGEVVVVPGVLVEHVFLHPLSLVLFILVNVYRVKVVVVVMVVVICGLLLRRKGGVNVSKEGRAKRCLNLA
jgi:hypothetical protein